MLECLLEPSLEPKAGTRIESNFEKATPVALLRGPKRMEIVDNVGFKKGSKKTIKIRTLAGGRGAPHGGTISTRHPTRHMPLRSLPPSPIHGTGSGAGLSTLREKPAPDSYA